MTLHSKPGIYGNLIVGNDMTYAYRITFSRNGMIDLAPEVVHAFRTGELALIAPAKDIGVVLAFCAARKLEWHAYPGSVVSDLDTLSGNPDEACFVCNGDSRRLQWYSRIPACLQRPPLPVDAAIAHCDRQGNVPAIAPKYFSAFDGKPVLRQVFSVDHFHLFLNKASGLLDLTLSPYKSEDFAAGKIGLHTTRPHFISLFSAFSDNGFRWAHTGDLINISDSLAFNPDAAFFGYDVTRHGVYWFNHHAKQYSDRPYFSVYPSDPDTPEAFLRLLHTYDILSGKAYPTPDSSKRTKT